MAKDYQGQKFRRKIGQRRVRFCIRKHFGTNSILELRGREVRFMCDQGESYCLTKQKRYKILDVNISGWKTDKELVERFNDVPYDKKRKVYVEHQDHGDTITIINDKGHKVKYYHEMFDIIKEGF